MTAACPRAMPHVQTPTLSLYGPGTIPSCCISAKMPWSLVRNARLHFRNPLKRGTQKPLSMVTLRAWLMFFLQRMYCPLDVLPCHSVTQNLPVSFAHPRTSCSPYPIHATESAANIKPTRIISASQKRTPGQPCRRRNRGASAFLFFHTPKEAARFQYQPYVRL